MKRTSDGSNPQHIEESGGSQATKAARSKDIATRWGGDPAILALGWVGVPTLFLERLASLKPFSLNPAEALFVINLMAFKWDSRAPYPSYGRLAQRMGISTSYARKLARQLETKGMLKRRKRIGATNEFDLSPLFSKILEKAQPTKVLKKPRHRPKPASRSSKTG